MIFTEKEKAIFLGSRDNDYANVFEEGCTWTFAVIDSSGLSPKEARGVLSSLIKKEIIVIEDYDDDTIFSYTIEGKKLALKNL